MPGQNKLECLSLGRLEINLERSNSKTPSEILVVVRKARQEQTPLLILLFISNAGAK
jgi:hypothetical protein